MNRLTKFNENYGFACNVSECYFKEDGMSFTCEAHDDCFACSHMWDMVEKLAVYEDTGLEPEDVQKVADFMKLFPKLCEKYILDGREEIE